VFRNTSGKQKQREQEYVYSPGFMEGVKVLVVLESMNGGALKRTQTQNHNVKGLEEQKRKGDCVSGQKGEDP